MEQFLEQPDEKGSHFVVWEGITPASRKDRVAPYDAVAAGS
jgi:hypothetical protein